MYQAECPLCWQQKVEVILEENHRDLAIISISGQIPKNTMRALRNSPLLGNLMFHISPEDLERPKKRRKEHYMFQVLRQVAQLNQTQPPEFKVPFMVLLLPFNQSLYQELLRTLPLSSSNPSPRLVEKPVNTNTKLSRLQSSKSDPRNKDHTTQKGSDYPLSFS